MDTKLANEAGQAIRGYRPRRAKDFAKCTDPECWMHKQWQSRERYYPQGFPRPPHPPHCHPVY